MVPASSFVPGEVPQVTLRLVLGSRLVLTLPTHFDVASSQYLVVKFVQPRFGSFSRLFALMGALSSCIHGKS